MGTREKLEALEKRYAMAFVKLRGYEGAVKTVRTGGIGILDASDRAMLMIMRDVFAMEIDVLEECVCAGYRPVASGWLARLRLCVAQCAFLVPGAEFGGQALGEMMLGAEEMLMLRAMTCEHNKLVRWVRDHFPSERPGAGVPFPAPASGGPGEQYGLVGTDYSSGSESSGGDGDAAAGEVGQGESPNLAGDQGTGK